MPYEIVNFVNRIASNSVGNVSNYVRSYAEFPRWLLPALLGIMSMLSTIAGWFSNQPDDMRWFFNRSDDFGSLIVPESEETHEDIDIEHKFTKERSVEKDQLRRARYVADQQKRHQARLRKQGIKKALKMIPEMEEADESENPSFMTSRIIQLLEQAEYSMRNDTIGFIARVITSASSFLIKLSLCDSWENTLKIFTTLVLDNVRSDKIIAAILGDDRQSARMLIPEFNVDFDVWRSTISNFRSNATAMRDTPAYEAIRKSLIILVFTGIAEHEKLNDSKFGNLMTNIFGKVERQCDIGELTFVDAVLELTEFAFSMAHAIKKGNSMHSFLFPKTAVARLAQYSSWLDPYRQGTIEEVAGLSPEEYVAEVKSLEVELSMILASKDIKGSMRTLHYQNYKAAVKLSADVCAFQYGSQFRIQPMSVIIYGVPRAGKSDVMQQMHAVAVTVNGLEFNLKDVYTFRDSDPYDSSLRNDHICYTADDIGNIKDKNVDPRETVLGKLINIVNNVPSPSVQAAVEDKGKIFHSPISVVASTNIIGGGIERVTNCVASYNRRIRHCELRPLPQFRGPDGGIDEAAVEAAGRDVTVTHEARWFKIIQTGTAVRRGETGPWMSLPNFYRDYGNICREHFLRQRNYILHQNKQFGIKRCPSCGQPPNTVHCSCHAHEIRRAQEIINRMGNTCARDAVIPKHAVETEDLDKEMSTWTEEAAPLEPDLQSIAPELDLGEDEEENLEDFDDPEPPFADDLNAALEGLDDDEEELILPEFGLSDFLSNQNIDMILSWIVDHEWAWYYLGWAFRTFRRYLPNFRASRVGRKIAYGYDYVVSYYAFKLIFWGMNRSRCNMLKMIGLSTFASCLHGFIWKTGMSLIGLPILIQNLVALFMFVSWQSDVTARISRSILSFRQRTRIQLGEGINPLPIAFGIILFIYGLYRTCFSKRSRGLEVVGGGRIDSWESSPKIDEVESEFDEETVVSIRESDVPVEEQVMLPETILPEDMNDVKARKAEVDMWLSTYKDSLPAPMELRSMTLDQVCNRVARNLFRADVYLDVTSSEKCTSGQGLFVSPGVVMFPSHMGRRSQYNLIGHREPSQPQKKNHTSFRTMIHSRKNIAPDFAFFRSTRMQPVSNMLKFFPQEIPKMGSRHAAVMITQTATGYITQNISWETREVNHIKAIGIGSKHTLKEQTKPGDCISPIISRDAPHVILGFHMGSDCAKTGMAFSICQKDVIACMGDDPSSIPFEEVCRLGLVPPVEPPKEMEPEMESSDETECTEDSLPIFNPVSWSLDSVSKDWKDFTGTGILTDWLGIDNKHAVSGNRIVELEQPIHERSCVNFLQYDPLIPPDMNLLGFDKSYITHPKTCVKTSILSEHLAAEGYPNKWSGPTFRSGRDHSTYLQLGTKSIDPLNPKVLSLSCRDWYYGVIKKLEAIDYPRDKRPITLDLALNGIPGDRFVKQVDETTAAGPGFGKKKKNHLTVVFLNDDDEEVPEGMGRKKLIPSPHLQSKIKEHIENLSKGNFVSMFVRSSLKDEPALVKEDGTTKIRIFGVLSFDMLLIGKMLFAETVSALLSIPTVSELYQGISVLGPDWTEFARHVLFFEPEQVGEGDYSKYDTSMSGQLIRAVGDCLINVSCHLGYPRWAQKAMTAYIESVALNAWIFNGAIFIVDGWQPSGNWLTAIIAGVGNSLLHRMVFYQYMRTWVPFRRYVHLATLGDDSLFSTICPWYNCITIQRYFSSINMKYTPASDKGGEIQPFVKWYDATFGKRTWRFEPVFNCFVAPLNEDSIFKSLHNYMESSTDDITIAIGVVDQALLEYTRHGKRKFVKFQALMKRVCRAADIDHMVNNLYKDYEDLIHFIFERQFVGQATLICWDDSASLGCTIPQDGGEL